MRRILAAIFVTACSSHTIPVVSVAVLPVTPPTTPVEETLLGECRIVGTGERTHWSEDAESTRFDVFASREARAPSLVIASPGAVAVTWSHFPSPADHKHRAQVALGGQKHVRFDGWSSLEGRTFTAEKRLFAEPGHLWARVGAPIAMLGAEGRVAVARVDTPFVSPKTLVVRGACDGVSYQPDEPERASPPERKSLATATNRSKALPLFAAPSGSPFTTLTFENEATLSLDVMERKDGFVRVMGEIEDIGVDAWVRAGDVDEDSLAGIGLHGFGTSGCGGVGSAEHGTVKRDAALFIGATPVALSGAVVERDAEIRWQRGDETTVDGRTYVAFDFEDFTITAAGDGRMWIAKDAIGPR